MTSTVDGLRDEIERRGIAADETINPFWKKLISALAPGRPESLGYRLRKLDRDGNRARFAALLQTFGDEIVPMQGHLRDIVDRIEQGEIERVENWEHAGALMALHTYGRLDEYIDFVDGLGVQSCMPAARYFLYSDKIAEYIREPATFIEIGAGAGELARFLLNRGIVARYIVVDLPEMLMNLADNLADTGLSFALNEVADAGFSLVTPDRIDAIPSHIADCALNFNSFMEMDRDVRDGYFDLIYRVTKPDGLFYNVNRRQRAMTMRDGTSFDNNPLLYPYRTDDAVLEWSPDPIQQDCRSRFGRSPTESFAISRVARVRPA